MQTHKISEIIEQIKILEVQLENELQKRREEYYCDIGKFSVFKDEVIRKHEKDVENIFRYLANAPILYVITAPIIWSVIFPAIFLDLFVTLYQTICFPVYKIQKVKRGDYISIDRAKLKYLNIVEKINCTYCGYFNGLLGYVVEVASRTEQFWCPIKHARKISFLHSKYQNFFDYGDSESFRKDLKKLREDLDSK